MFRVCAQSQQIHLELLSEASGRVVALGSPEAEVVPLQPSAPVHTRTNTCADAGAHTGARDRDSLQGAEQRADARAHTGADARAHTGADARAHGPCGECRCRQCRTAHAHDEIQHFCNHHRCSRHCGDACQRRHFARRLCLQECRFPGCPLLWATAPHRDGTCCVSLRQPSVKPAIPNVGRHSRGRNS